MSRYPSLVQNIAQGFSVGFPSIHHTYTPLNHHSLLVHASAFAASISRELVTGRYLGPFTQSEVEDLIGPFHTSPLSIIPKPHKPNSFRIIQNFSFPYTPVDGVSSMNAGIESDQYPCTWGTFVTVALLFSQLPKGSQAAVRDVSEAYRSIPLHHSQWPGAVVRTSNSGEFCIDTSASFGGAANCGVFGACADAACDILRAEGIGPIVKWVDDHVFVRIKSHLISAYNQKRREWRRIIDECGGQHHSGGRLWYGGRVLADERIEEFAEDMVFPLQVLTTGEYPYTLESINAITDPLGIVWELSKDQDFAPAVTFTGLLWDLDGQTVQLTESKRVKYLCAIKEWRAKPLHTLEETQKLLGKLLHASQVAPSGRAYLTCLESFLGVFGDSPKMPRRPPRGTDHDLSWWVDRLSRPHSPITIPGPVVVLGLDAYSDASSRVGVGIVMGGRWRAWKLRAGWDCERRDIGWAEAVGFELLVRAVVQSNPPHPHVRIFGDNQGVVAAWRNGRSRNPRTNEVFKRVHELLERVGLHVYCEYVPSANNPADGPSRGQYPPWNLLLPPIELPPDVEPLLRCVEPKR